MNRAFWTLVAIACVAMALMLAYAIGENAGFRDGYEHGRRTNTHHQ